VVALILGRLQMVGPPFLPYSYWHHSMVAKQYVGVELADSDGPWPRLVQVNYSSRFQVPAPEWAKFPLIFKRIHRLGRKSRNYPKKFLIRCCSSVVLRACCVFAKRHIGQAVMTAQPYRLFEWLRLWISIDPGCKAVAEVQCGVDAT
jgi:hypothetical protein